MMEHKTTVIDFIKHKLSFYPQYSSLQEVPGDIAFDWGTEWVHNKHNDIEPVEPKQLEEVSDEALKIAEKYVYGRNDALTDSQEVKDLAQEIESYSLRSRLLSKQKEETGKFINSNGLVPLLCSCINSEVTDINGKYICCTCNKPISQ